LPVIDVAYENPQLLLVVIDTLARMKDDRARFFLADQMQTASPRVRRKSAYALSQVGGQALEYLRSWALAEDPGMRETALEFLLPTAQVGDLTTLYEYLALFPDDDPELLAKLRARAELLEQAILRQEEIDSRTPPLDD
jgi:HEAT repeat protein